MKTLKRRTRERLMSHFLSSDRGRAVLLAAAGRQLEMLREAAESLDGDLDDAGAFVVVSMVMSVLKDCSRADPGERAAAPGLPVLLAWATGYVGRMRTRPGVERLVTIMEVLES